MCHGNRISSELHSNQSHIYLSMNQTNTMLPDFYCRSSVADERICLYISSRTPDTWAEKFESFERINSIRETNGNFDSCNSCKRLGTSRLHELHESKFPFVSRIEFIRSKLSNFSAHVSGVKERTKRERKQASLAPAGPPGLCWTPRAVSGLSDHFDTERQVLDKNKHIRSKYAFMPNVTFKTRFWHWMRVWRQQ